MNFKVFTRIFISCFVFSIFQTQGTSATASTTDGNLFDFVEDVTFWSSAITDTSFQVNGCLQLVGNTRKIVSDQFALQSILSKSPDFSQVVSSYTSPSFGGAGSSIREDCDISPHTFQQWSFDNLESGTNYWFRYSLKFCNDVGTRNWENCASAKTFTFNGSVKTTGSKPTPTPTPTPTSTKTKNPTPKPSNSSSTNPNEDVDDGDVDGVQISIKKSGSNFRFSISDAEPKIKVKIIASKKGSKNVTWNKKTNSNGNLSFSTTRNLKNWTVKIYIDNELEDTIKIK